MAGDEAALSECLGCGLQQFVPSLAPHGRARCVRCNTTLGSRRRNTLEPSLALALAALVLLIITATTTLMRVEQSGIVHLADLITGPVELLRHGMPGLAAAVVFTSLLAPFANLAGTIYVLTLLHLPNPPRHLRHVFLLVRRLGP
ncbi:MAG: paraquat-inducible protein A, partial [Acetobacteraceae bacterium]